MDDGYEGFMRSGLYTEQDKDNYELWIMAEGEDPEVAQFFAIKPDIVWIQPDADPV